MGRGIAPRPHRTGHRRPGGRARGVSPRAVDPGHPGRAGRRAGRRRARQGRRRARTRGLAARAGRADRLGAPAAAALARGRGFSLGLPAVDTTLLELELPRGWVASGQRGIRRGPMPEGDTGLEPLGDRWRCRPLRHRPPRLPGPRQDRQRAGCLDQRHHRGRPPPRGRSGRHDDQLDRRLPAGAGIPATPAGWSPSSIQGWS